MKLRELALLVFAGLMLGVAPARANVAILGAPDDPSWNTDVQSKILASGVSLGSVDIINIANSTPSLATLETYSAVLVYTDNAFTQSGSMGNVLADYVDAGGGVVQMVFANATIPLGGRWDSGGYDAISTGGSAGQTELTLGTIDVPGNPLFNGVTSFDGGTSSYHSTGAVINGATLLAQWSNGDPFAAELTDKAGTIISLNFYPPSSDVRSDFWVSTTDGGLLMANALAEASVAVVTPIPEPSTLAIAGLSGLAMLALGLRSRRQAA